MVTVQIPQELSNVSKVNENSNGSSRTIETPRQVVRDKTHFGM